MASLSRQLVLGGSLLAAAGMLPATAFAATFAAGARVSTLGLGLEGTVGLTEYLNLRVPFNALTYSDNLNEDGIDYDADLKLGSFGLQLDYHPFKGTFYLSAGLYSNSNKFDLLAQDKTGETEYTLGDDDRVYTSASETDPLTLDGGLDFNSTAPYIGFGWGNAIQGASSLYFRFEAGAYFQGSPKVRLKGYGTAIDQETGTEFDTTDGSAESIQFQQEIEEERASLEDDISKYDIYPAISLAIGYRFGGGQ